MIDMTDRLLGDFMDPTSVASQLMSGAFGAPLVSLLLTLALICLTIVSAYNIGSFAKR